MENCIAQAKLAVNLHAIIEWITVSGVEINEKFRRAIERHNILAGRLESAWEQKEEDRTLANLKQDYKNTVKDLLRLIRAHPHVISGWEAQPPIELGENESAIIRGLEEFHSLMVERMLSSGELEHGFTKQEEVELKQLIIEEQRMAAAIKDLDEKAETEENKKGLEREEEELRQLEKPFAELKVEYDKVMEKRRLAEEKRREEQMELELKTKAAIIGQAWWRGYSTRKALKKESKKPPKKGKGKKTKKR